MAKPCRACGGTNHATTFCFNNRRSPMRQKKHPRRAGKNTVKWLKVRAEWFATHPPNHQGYYVCHYCGDWLTPDLTTLDHVLPRSKRPDLRFDMNNLVPCCYRCNQEKGSKILEPIL